MEQNNIAKALRIIGVSVMVFGFFIGFIIGVSHPFLSFLFFEFFIFALIGLIVGMVFIALAEMISLLQKIYAHLVPAPVLEPTASKTDQAAQEQSYPIAKADMEKIEALYDGNQQKIIRTPYDSLCVVIADNVPHVVDIGGFQAMEVKEQALVQKAVSWYKNEQNDE